MLKRDAVAYTKWITDQPPSGGCVLKPFRRAERGLFADSAAFGRLCVETDDVKETENE